MASAVLLALGNVMPTHPKSIHLSRLVAMGSIAVAAACSAQSTSEDGTSAADLILDLHPTTPDPNNRWMKGVDVTKLAIGDEVVLGDELSEFQNMVRVMNGIQDKLASRNGGIGRGAHHKAPLCTLGELRVHVPADHPEARVGLFARDATYPAWVRFSTGQPAVHPDKSVDSRGLAIKVMKVPGAKLLAGKEDALTQDFLGTNQPIAMTSDASQFLKLVQTTADAIVAGDDPSLHLPGDITARFSGVSFGPWNQLLVAGGFLSRPENARARNGLLGRTLPAVLTRGSLLQENFFSNGALAMGVQDGDPMTAHAKDAAKVRMVVGVPENGRCTPVSKHPNAADDNYLRSDMQARLSQGPVCIDLQLQFHRNPRAQFIEDQTVEWKESDSPFTTVASIVIPRMDMESPAAKEKHEFCQKLGFSPWHALREHRPLGNIMRARRLAYEGSREHRGGIDEPTGDEFELDGR